jgi:hypothetical protein
MAYAMRGECATCKTVLPRIPLLFGAVAILGCPKDSGSARPKYVGPPKVFYLIKAVEEAETATRPEHRDDVAPMGEGTEAIAAVVAKGESPPFSLGGGVARLYGDAGGTEGWSVDNAILFEVVVGGAVTHRFAVGYHDGLRIGSEEIDNLGRKAFQFGPGEIDITSGLPETGTFVLRATAIDTGNVGHVSNVFLIVGPPSGAGKMPDDDLQNR